jgi:hypothetical protein
MMEEIPAYLAGRLEGERLRGLESHLSECGECNDLVSDLREIVDGFRQGGSALLEACPDSLTLMKVATGAQEDPEGTVERHTETCEPCSLEFVIWKNRERGAVRTPRRTVSRSSIYRWAGMAAAAGLVLGLGLPAVYRQLVPGPTGPEPAIHRPWSGAVNLITLDGTIRGGGAIQSFTLSPDQPVVPLVLLPALPEGEEAPEAYRFAIIGGDGLQRWAMEMAGSEIEGILDLSAVLTLMIPAEVLPAGDYTLRMDPAGEAGGAPLMEEEFRIE